MKTTIVGLIVTALGYSGCTTAAVAPLPATFEIVGFYGAANNGGTFVRTVKPAQVGVGDRIVVTGTEHYDGTWTVLQAFPYKDPKDPQTLWGYRIEPKWRGLPPGFTNNGGVPTGNKARLQPVLAVPAESQIADASAAFELGFLDQVPIATYQVRPQYPAAMREKSIAGEVVVDFIVDKNGDVRNPFALRSTRREFEGAAVAAVSQWKFKPGQKGGRPVPAHMQAPIVFALK